MHRVVHQIEETICRGQFILKAVKSLAGGSRAPTELVLRQLKTTTEDKEKYMADIGDQHPLCTASVLLRQVLLQPHVS